MQVWAGSDLHVIEIKTGNTITADTRKSRKHESADTCHSIAKHISMLKRMFSHKLTSADDGQDTSAYEISGHSLYAFSGKCPETSPDGWMDMP